MINSTLKGEEIKKVKLAFIIILGALVLYWFSSIIIYGNESKQFGLFFSGMNDFLADFTNVVGYSSLRDPYNNEMYTGLAEKAYPPLVYVVAYLFSRLVNMQPYYDANYFKSMYYEPLLLFAFVVLVSVIMIYGYSIISSRINDSWYSRMGCALVMLLSGPTLYALERGNVIICVPFLCLSFFSFYDHENRALRELGLLALAIAAGIKLTPAILGLMLIYERRWKEAARTVLYGVIFIFAPFLFFKGGVSNFPLMLRNLGLLMHSYGSSDGCSIRNILELVGAKIGMNITPSISTVVTYALGLGLCVGGFYISEKWKRTLLLCIVLIMVPNYSAYYCAIYLIPGIVYFLNREFYQKTDVALLIAFILILNPTQTALQDHLIDYHLGFLILLLWAACTCMNKTKSASVFATEEVTIEK